MPLETFMVTVYCLVCEALNIVVPGGNPRKRGFPPKLSDAEALTMAFVGTVLGYQSDKAVWKYFLRHWAAGFPSLGDRSTFVRQLANLGHIEAFLHQHWARTLEAFAAKVHLVDGFPVPVCHPRRVGRRTLFRGEAGWGFCASKDEHYFGFHGLVLTTADGIITGVASRAAHIDERDALFDLPLEYSRGALFGNKGFIRPILTEDLSAMGMTLHSPLRRNMMDSRPKSLVDHIVSVRRRVETVIGQLAERFSAERTGARMLWQLVSRIYRKVAAHPLCVLLNQSLGRPLLDFEGLVTE
ncbi:MAG: IS982 family transposase [Candidatus Accumulibacter sp.]|uniref:IS982 family transposase n=2 Tax=Candidatus Accumulibacter TaxID=327159 RepID=A0A7D5SEY8_9PROT|nr:IS982 family transposase [Accumulibacter sp.]MCM8621916.1 IS982 family transposase [Accumulibacter sp.]QLH51837.1 MAG: IS982 family transposase [Candidatus Accumulibacter cognatus]